MENISKILEIFQNAYKRKIELKDNVIFAHFEHKKRKFFFKIINIQENIFSINLVWNKKTSAHYEFIKKLHISCERKDILKNLEEASQNIIEFLDKVGSIELSIVVPVYNREELIKPLIKSLNEQTLERDKFEVIFVDDCSTDNTKDTIYQNCKVNFRYLQRPVPSGGASMPRNDGICASTGDYILFIDSDDYLADKRVLEDTLGYAFRNNLDILFLKLSKRGEKDTNIRVFRGKNNLNDTNIFKDFLLLFGPPHKIFKNSFLKYYNLYFKKMKTNEDRIHTWQSIALTDKIGIFKSRVCLMITEALDSSNLSKSVDAFPLRIYHNFIDSLMYGLLIDEEVRKREFYNSLLYRIFHLNLDLSRPIVKKTIKIFEKYHELFDPNFIYIDKKQEVMALVNSWNNVSFGFKLKRLKWKLQDFLKTKNISVFVTDTTLKNAIYRDYSRFSRFAYVLSNHNSVLCINKEESKILAKSSFYINDEHIIKVIHKANKVVLLYKKRYICDIQKGGRFNFSSNINYFDLVEDKENDCFYIKQGDYFLSIEPDGNIAFTKNQLAWERIKILKANMFF
ncbi:glycosyltransferase family 2 protein [Campylobacter sp. CLAX-22107-21]|uniref:glycosyltransferase family 2 protein n=1 Tax=Campylobacter devanensis TaxID=3161138 RepID=UPI000A33E5F6|nr:glycosyltransferase family 2 protein [Campylobacter sp. P0209]MEE3694137.1 glycosyltransferase family 2 protein [Campylobacter sp. CLAX-22107-21]